LTFLSTGIYQVNLKFGGVEIPGGQFDVEVSMVALGSRSFMLPFPFNYPS